MGFCFLSTLVALKPLQNGADWGFWAVGLAGGFVFGAYFVPIVVTGGRAPGLLDDIVFGSLLVLYVVGIAASIAADSSGPAAVRE